MNGEFNNKNMTQNASVEVFLEERIVRNEDSTSEWSTTHLG